MNSPSPTKPEHFLHPRVGLVERPVQLLEQLVADVLAHGQRVEQRPFLEHHAEVGADRHQLVFVHVVDPLAVDEDLAGVRLQQAEHQPQDRRLAGAARAQEDLRVPGLQREADVAQDHLLVERQVDPVEHDDRPAVAERLVEQRRARCGFGTAISTSSTMRSLRHQEVDRDDRHRAGHDRVGRRAADALRAAASSACPTWQPMLTMANPRKNGLMSPIQTSWMYSPCTTLFQ